MRAATSSARVSRISASAPAHVAAAEQRDAHRRGGVWMWVGGGLGGHLQTVQGAAWDCPIRSEQAAHPTDRGVRSRWQVTPWAWPPQASSRMRSSKVSRRTATRAVPSDTKTTAGRGTLL